MFQNSIIYDCTITNMSLLLW